MSNSSMVSSSSSHAATAAAASAAAIAATCAPGWAGSVRGGWAGRRLSTQSFRFHPLTAPAFPLVEGPSPAAATALVPAAFALAPIPTTRWGGGAPTRGLSPLQNSAPCLMLCSKPLACLATLVMQCKGDSDWRSCWFSVKYVNGRVQQGEMPQALNPTRAQSIRNSQIKALSRHYPLHKATFSIAPTISIVYGQRRTDLPLPLWVALRSRVAMPSPLGQR